MKNQEMAGKIPLFDGTNFGFWKKRMSYYLMSIGPKVWKYVLNEYKAPPTLPTDQDGRKSYIANAKALNSITSGINDSKFTKVMGCDSAKNMWDKLIALYDGDSKVKNENLQTHGRKFEILKMDDEEDIASFFLQVVEVVSSLKSLEQNIEESIIVQKVLRSLPYIFESKLRKGSKLKSKYRLICFKCGSISQYAAKCPDKYDSDYEEEYKKGMFKKKGFNKKNFFSKQDDSDGDEFMITKKKSTKNIIFHKRKDDESDVKNGSARSREVLFMAFTNDDDSEQEGEGNVDELLMSVVT
eukprot:PITA_15055